MSLRCRVGEKAIILRGHYTGYTVTVVDYVGNITKPDIAGRMVSVKDAWEVDCPQFSVLGTGMAAMIGDQDLHAISPVRKNMKVPKNAR